MTLARLHLFELEDQPWFPRVIRDLATDYLRFVEHRFELHRPVVQPLAQLLRTTQSDRIVDLCSGGGGPVPSLLAALSAEGIQVEFVLTDRYPNIRAFEAIAASAPRSISFVSEPVDAKSVPAHLRGTRTIFNAFHHFTPDDAIAVLRNAAQSRQPIGVFEIPDRRISTLLPLLLLTPIIVLLATPFIRPFRWSRLLYTYIVPLVPVTCWWDGVVSTFRAYTVLELEQLSAAVGADHMRWNAGRTPIGSTPGALTYLVGWPDDVRISGSFAAKGS